MLRDKVCCLLAQALGVTSLGSFGQVQLWQSYKPASAACTSELLRISVITTGALPAA